MKEMIGFELMFIGVLLITNHNIGYSKNDKANPSLKLATFAGGCFWCMEPPYKDLPGVIKVVPGYTGGHTKNPTYADVSSGKTGHREAVQITYDPSKVTFSELLDVFWQQIDPTDPDGQFYDKGSQYKTAIFYNDDEQRREAEKSKEELNKSGRFDKPVVTDILQASTFYEAEAYHHDYYKKNPAGYKSYKEGSGRDKFIRTKWGDIMKIQLNDKKYRAQSDEELKKKLTPLQYSITRQSCTEAPFDNEFWNNDREGIYVDIVSGAPLFSSLDKFKSGTGWPSFTRPLESGNIVQVEDRSHSMIRTEVRSKQGDSHLGHVFDDGPAPTGTRYCINSAALRFIPKEDLKKEGYGEYLKLFGK